MNEGWLRNIRIIEELEDIKRRSEHLRSFMSDYFNIELPEGTLVARLPEDGYGMTWFTYVDDNNELRLLRFTQAWDWPAPTPNITLAFNGVSYFKWAVMQGDMEVYDSSIPCDVWKEFTEGAYAEYYTELNKMAQERHKEYKFYHSSFLSKIKARFKK